MLTFPRSIKSTTSCPLPVMLPTFKVTILMVFPFPLLSLRLLLWAKFFSRIRSWYGSRSPFLASVRRCYCASLEGDALAGSRFVSAIFIGIEAKFSCRMPFLTQPFPFIQASATPPQSYCGLSRPSPAVFHLPLCAYSPCCILPHSHQNGFSLASSWQYIASMARSRWAQTLKLPTQNCDLLGNRGDAPQRAYTLPSPDVCLFSNWSAGTVVPPSEWRHTCAPFFRSFLVAVGRFSTFLRYQIM